MSRKAASSLYNIYLLSNAFALNKWRSTFFKKNVLRTHDGHCFGDRQDMISTTLIHTGRRQAKAVTPKSETFTAALLESPKTAGCAAA